MPVAIRAAAFLRMAGFPPVIPGTETWETFLAMRQKVTPSEDPDESRRAAWLFSDDLGPRSPVISGDNAWYGIISLLREAYVQYGRHIPADAKEFRIALETADHLIHLQAKNGGIYLAPKETTDITRIPRRDISNAHAAEVAMGLKMVIEAMSGSGYSGREKYVEALNRIADYIRHHAFNEGERWFYAGGKYGDYDKGAFLRNSDRFHITPYFAADVQWNILGAFGPETIDRWFGDGMSYEIWNTVKRRAGVADREGRFLGFGLVDGQDHIHGIVTQDAIDVGAALIAHYGGDNAAVIQSDLQGIQLYGLPDLETTLPDGTQAMREARIYDPALQGIKPVWWAKEPESGLKERPDIQATALRVIRA